MDKSWINWMETNLNRGCSKEDVFKTLKKNNFEEKEINKHYNIYLIKKNKYLILENYHNFNEILKKNFLFKKYKNDKIILYLTNNFLSESTIENINDNIIIIDKKINKLLHLQPFETTDFELINKFNKNFNKIENNKVITWFSLLITEKSKIKIKNIKKNFNLLPGTILFISIFNEKCEINKNIIFKTSKPIYYKEIFKII